MRVRVGWGNPELGLSENSKLCWGKREPRFGIPDHELFLGDSLGILALGLSERGKEGLERIPRSCERGRFWRVGRPCERD